MKTWLQSMAEKNRRQAERAGLLDAVPVPPPVPSVPRPPRWYAGCDLGQSSDYSALAIIERHEVPDEARPGRNTYDFHVRQLHRWALRTSYVDIVGDLKKLYDKEPLKGTPLAVDRSGVGRGVTDMLRDSGITATLRPFTITCGRAISHDAIAKVHLVASVTAPLCSGRLKFAKGLDLTPALVAELENYRVTVDEQTRNESYAAGRSGGAHDDLVCALAIGLYVASLRTDWHVSGLT